MLRTFWRLGAVGVLGCCWTIMTVPATGGMPAIDVIGDGQLLAERGAFNDRLGWAIFIPEDGDTALVAARYWNERRGRVLEFTRDASGVWQQTDQLTPADAAPGDDFGDGIVVDGDLALIGAIQDDAEPSGAGKAHFFERTPRGWQEVASVAPADGISGDYFGFTCGLDGNHALIGAPRFGTPVATPGKVYAYQRSGGAWGFVQVLQSDEPQTGDEFGATMAMDGSRAVIGAAGHSGGRGAAYVFQRRAGGWSQVQSLLPADITPNDGFGLDVALSGNVMLVGAALANVQVLDAVGRVYVYEHDGTQWVQQQVLAASDGPDAGVTFGVRLGLDGDRAIVGADGDEEFSGAAYLFQRIGGMFQEQAKIVALDGGPLEFFGRDVAVRRDRVMIGAMLHDAAGAAYAYDLQTICPSDADGNGAVDIDDLLLVLLQWGPCAAACPADVNDDGAADVDDLITVILGLSGPDCNGNGAPDACDIASGTNADCNANGVPDECDLTSGVSIDANANGVPDECDPDCNGNNVPDDLDIATGGSADCNANDIPDECDLASGTSGDCNANAIPDECEDDCNSNGIDDACDIDMGTSSDLDGDGVPDECQVPSNDSCGSATVITTGPVAINTVGATTSPIDGDDCDTLHKDVWYRLINIDCGGTITLSVCDPTFDVLIAVYGSACPDGPGDAIACDNEVCGRGSSITLDASPGTIYRVRVGGAAPGAAGTGVLEVVCE